MIISSFRKKILKADNNRELLVNISGAFFIKGIALFITLFTMPAFMSYFQNQQVLGVWFTLLSILTWILMFDLGIGNGLRNHLVSAFAENNKLKIKQLISSSYIILGFLSLFIMLFGVFFIYNSNWNNILNINNSVISNMVLKKAVLYSFLGLILHFFLKIILSILNAMQKTALSSLIMLFSNVFLLIYILCFDAKNDAQNLLNISFIYILTMNVPILISTLLLFSKKLNYAIPSYKFYVSDYAQSVLKLGGQFFWIQVAFMVITSTNEIIITWLFDPIYVVEYQVYNRLFYTFVMLFSLISSPMWSAVTKAYSEKRFDWIRRVYRVLNLAVLFSIVFCFIIILFLQPIVNFWLGSNTIVIDYYIAIFFAIFSSIMIFNFSMTSIANGIGKLKPQLIGYTLIAILRIPLCFFVAKIVNNWVSVIIINIILLIPYLIWQHIKIKKELNELSLKFID